MPDQNNPVNNFYDSTVYNGDVTNPVQPCSNNFAPIEPRKDHTVLLVVIGALLLAAIVGYFYYQESRKPAYVVPLEDGSGVYDAMKHEVFKVDHYETNAQVIVDTAKIYSQERIALGRVCKEKTGSTRSRTIYRTPVVNNYNFEQSQEQRQEYTAPPPEIIKTEPPVIIRQDPEPVKEKKSCKEKVREQRDDNDGNNKDINQ